MYKHKILVVCLGNICRSPIAEGLFQKIIEEKDLQWVIDSAGTSGWHNGEGPDERSIRVCKNNGIDISKQVSRKVIEDDFIDFDLILAMDDKNLKVMQELAPLEMRHKLHRMMDFLPQRSNEIVPDPYYDNRFQEVFELLQEVIEGSISKIESLLK